MSGPFAMNSYQGKEILALVREGDYAHPGEEEAIRLALARLAKDSDRQILDAGCGRGGTAAYMQTQGWGRVTGIDIEPKSIAYAKETFPELTWQCCDIFNVADAAPGGFDVVTMFNVLYALADQAAALAGLSGRTKPGGRLMVFDYIDRGGYTDTPVMDAGNPFLPHPPARGEIEALLEAGGWQLTSVDDITEAYARWYGDLVGKIENKRAVIEDLAGHDAYVHVLGRYTGLLTAIREGRLGGAIIYGEKVAP